jgi:tetratricopeptide (TPR) repeat protein
MLQELRATIPALLAAALAVLPVQQGGAPSKDATRLGSPDSLPAGSSRESMWPAPTAEDWKLPCLVAWQRTFADALKVAKETGKPILICVNMDGEVASEHYAGIRYRRPETARLFEPYVCVIASVYRHNPRDYDEQGRRVPCPRFGTVTCGEHIAIEPGLFDEFFDGRRIAPRHIQIELDRKKVYDVYFAWDTDTIFNALRSGVAGRAAPKPTVRDDVPIVDRVESSDAADRAAVETAYRGGTPEVRRALIESTIRHKDVDQVDLLRLAIFGFDVELARLARRALAQCDSESAVDLLAEALKMPMEPTERELLLAAVARLGEKYPRARTLAAVHQGLAQTSKRIDSAGWSSEIEARSHGSARGDYERASRLEQREDAAVSRPDDAASSLDLAESFLAKAAEPRNDKRFVQLLYADARRTALDAEKLGAKGWRLDAVLALSLSALGEHDASLASAVAAVEGGMPSPSSGAEGVGEGEAVGVLALFAEARQRAIAKAYHEKATWPAEWLSDIHAAYAVLARHPLGTDVHVASHYDFLRWLGATPRATDVLEQGFQRFPDSWILHDRLRGQILWEKGPDGLEAEYAARLAKENPPQNLEWFAGYASIVAAEAQRRAGATDKARAAYDRAAEHFQRAAVRNPDSRESAATYTALAAAGRARLDLEAGNLEPALRELLAAFAARPEAAATLDGLNISPVDTAKMLRARLAEAHREDLVKELQVALDALSPELLELPPYERDVQDPPAASPPPRRRRQ